MITLEQLDAQIAALQAQRAKTIEAFKLAMAQLDGAEQVLRLLCVQLRRDGVEFTPTQPETAPSSDNSLDTP